MKRSLSVLAVAAALFASCSAAAWAQDPAIKQDAPDPATTPATLQNVTDAVALGASDAKVNGDTAWVLTSTALVMFMVPGLALFYGGMVRRKNVLATMMQSMVALAVVGVFWIAIGYNLAFGQTQGGFFGWSEKLIFLKDVQPADKLEGTNITVYAHMLFQGMFAIITPALISGAIAERIRFGPYCLFILLWVTLVYCPLAHMVWAMNWWAPVQMLVEKDGATVMEEVAKGTAMVGYLGKNTLNGGLGALDFAGGTVVHIAAGLSGLACILVLRKRIGYPEHSMHPNSMVLTLLGAGLLWFGWFGFNGGSALGSGLVNDTAATACSAFAATQAAAAAAALSWLVAEWLHKGKPTALGFASGVVAGLVAVTPASGFVYVWGGLAIGLIAGVVCYAAVCLKAVFGYDDSLDAFGVHGVGGFLGAVLTGIFCYIKVNPAGADGFFATWGTGNSFEQALNQLKASGVSVAIAFFVTLVLAKVVDDMFGLITSSKAESEGLDRSEHGEVGFDLGPALEMSLPFQEPKAATVPPNGLRRFTVVVDGAPDNDLMKVWSKLCQSGANPPAKQFLAVYPNMTTVEGNRFHFRGGDPKVMGQNLQHLFQENGLGVKTSVEEM